MRFEVDSTGRGPTAAALRQAKLMFFAAAFMSFVLSVYLFFSGDRERGIFVGLWVPSILSAGNMLMSGRHHE